MINNEPKYYFDDLAIVPCEEPSPLDSRSQCNPYVDGEKMLPIFASAMYSVTNKDNYDTWVQNGIQAILPRTVKYVDRLNALIEEGKWVAFSQKEFNNLFCDNPMLDLYKGKKMYVSVDTANAHRKSIYASINQAKDIAKANGYELVIMVGNIANPKTYEWICRHAKVDYVRLVVGNGYGCFVNGTKVKTSAGDVNIENVNIGDRVLTIDGTYKRVTDKISYETNDLIKVNSTICTPNHKFFVVNKCDKDFINETNIMQYGYWVEAEKLNKDTHLLIKLYE